MSELSPDWQTFLRTRDDRARERLITSNLNIVERVLRSFQNVRPQDKEDLRGSGRLGLIRAIDEFDGERMEVNKYLSLRVRYAMVDAIRSSGSSFVKKGTRAQARELEQTIEQLESRLGRPPADEEIADELGIALDELNSMNSRLYGFEWRPVSLDFNEETEGPWVESVADHSSIGEDPASKSLRAERSAMLADLLSRLSERERYVVEQRFFAGRSQTSIAGDLGVHESRVSQIVDESLARLRTLARQQPLRLGEEAAA